jgi:uncharacterized protein YndB with AHSA1/START domain
MSNLGRYVEVDGRPAVRFERTYPHPADRLWAAVTEPDQLKGWFPSNVAIEPRVGGTVTFDGDPNIGKLTGTVLTYDPPRRIAFTWGPDELQFDVEALGETQSRLTLTNVLSERDAAARNASGWTVCLGELDNLMAGEASDGPHTEANQAKFLPLLESYVAAGLPSGADIPGYPDLQ